MCCWTVRGTGVVRRARPLLLLSMDGTRPRLRRPRVWGGSCSPEGRARRRAQTARRGDSGRYRWLLRERYRVPDPGRWTTFGHCKFVGRQA